MAIFFPKFEEILKLKQAPESGEIHVLEILKGLSDEYEVFFQPCINGHKPDIVLVRKGYGVLILEVKDWDLNKYVINGDDWRIKGDISNVKSPVKQVEMYKNDLFDLSIPSLLKEKIQNKKIYGIVQTAVFFHNEKSETIKNSIDQSSFCPVFANDDFTVDKLNQHRYLLRKYPNKFFSEEIYKEFKRLLKPSFHTIEQTKNLPLNERQKELSKSENKHRKIRGFAGSGKTLILAKRAVNAHLRHGGKVLILTFNITLKNYIHDCVSRVKKEFDWENFLIIHYSGFIRAEANNHNIKYVDYSDINLFDNVKEKIKKYNTILIDEVQDYHVEWLRILN